MHCFELGFQRSPAGRHSGIFMQPDEEAQARVGPASDGISHCNWQLTAAIACKLHVSVDEGPATGGRCIGQHPVHGWIMESLLVTLCSFHSNAIAEQAERKPLSPSGRRKFNMRCHDKWMYVEMRLIWTEARACCRVIQSAPHSANLFCSNIFEASRAYQRLRQGSSHRIACLPCKTRLTQCCCMMTLRS